MKELTHEQIAQVNGGLYNFIFSYAAGKALDYMISSTIASAHANHGGSTKVVLLPSQGFGVL